MKIAKRIRMRSSSGFTLIELIISMALIVVAISIFIQTSGAFNDRLSLILKRIETKTQLLHLTVYLRDLSVISDSISFAGASNEIVFEKNGDAFARCGRDASGSSIQCVFESSSGLSPRPSVPIFNLSEHGFSDMAWESTSINGVTRHALVLMRPGRSAGIMNRSQKIEIFFTLLPGIHEIFPP